MSTKDNGGGRTTDIELDDVIAEYVRACEDGSPPDRKELTSRYPQLADELRDFLDTATAWTSCSTHCGLWRHAC